MKTTDSLVIVGAGAAASELAFAARSEGWTGDINVLGEEDLLPYHRPPLSKAFLSETTDPLALLIKPAQAYTNSRITVRTGARVSAILPASHELVLAGGERMAYTRLALCTGSRARELQIEGLPPSPVPRNMHYLRTLEDARALRAGLVRGARLVVIGGGYVGLEVASVARQLGVELVLLETQPRVLSRVTGAVMSAFYEREHRQAGVDLRTGIAIQSIECATDPHGQPVFQAVRCADGSRILGDALLVGIGGLPNVGLAAQAGLAIDGGIVVDEHACTSVEHIYAAGDCTVLDSVHYGRRLRLESVSNALEQARAAAAHLCGKHRPYRAVPWFWSDQFGLKLQMAGLSQGHTEVVRRGDMQQRSFSIFYLNGQCLLAVDAVNRPADFIMGRRLIHAGIEVQAAQLADEALPLTTLLANA